MSTIDDIITAVIKREGGAASTNHPADGGGRTQYGIAERSHPQAWLDDKVTEEEARAIYKKRYVEGPGFAAIPDAHLMAQLVDFGVNSGPAVAITKLQKVLGVKEDGILGPATQAALALRDSRQINNELMCERIRMIGRIVSKNKSQAVFINGWLSRACEFLRGI